MAIDSPTLPAPYEILDLPDGGTATFHIRSAKEGTLPLTRKDGGPQKIVNALRILTAPGDKQMGPAFWDITSQLLIVQLREHLTRPDLARVVFTVKKFGVAPSARFSLEVKPG